MNKLATCKPATCNSLKANPGWNLKFKIKN